MDSSSARITTLATLAGIASWGGLAEAQPLTGGILQNVAVEDQCISVTFAFPLQYIGHFPPDVGEEVRIRFRPNVLGRIDGNALRGRESVRPPDGAVVHLTEVIFEGGGLSGSSLFLRFDRPVNFRVGVGRDFRSIVVFVGEMGANTRCLPY